MVHLFTGPKEITYILINTPWTMKRKMHARKNKIKSNMKSYTEISCLQAELLKNSLRALV